MVVSKGGQGRFDFSKAEKVIVKIPEKGHVYEIRSGKYLGFTDTFEMRILPAWSMFYAVLPRPVKQVTLKAPAAAAPGSKAVFDFAVEGTVGPQVFHFALYGPDGKELEHCARNFSVPAGKGRHTVFFPFNAPRGVWRAEVTHVVSGKKASVKVAVK